MAVTRMNMALYNILKRLPDITEEEAVKAASMDSIGLIEDDIMEIKNDIKFVKRIIGAHFLVVISIFWMLWNLTNA